MVSFKCDICPDPELRGQGRWKIEKDSVLIDWVERKDGKKPISDFYGACTELHLFLFFDEQKKSQNVVLLSSDKEAKIVSSHFVQRAAYHDWKSDADSLGGSKE